MPGSRKQKQLSAEEIQRIADTYAQYRKKSRPEEIPGFCRVATVDEIREHRYALTPGRYVGSQEGGDLDEPFEERFGRLRDALLTQLKESENLSKTLRAKLAVVGEAQ